MEMIELPAGTICEGCGEAGDAPVYTVTGTRSPWQAHRRASCINVVRERLGMEPWPDDYFERVNEPLACHICGVADDDVDEHVFDEFDYEMDEHPMSGKPFHLDCVVDAVKAARASYPRAGDPERSAVNSGEEVK